MTEKLYYKSSKIKSFTATVLHCEKAGDFFKVILDKTAFFPESGGQASDIGTIGDASVFDVKEENGELVHYCDKLLPESSVFPCEIDWERRFAFMQNHSGEHIVAGLIHTLYGFENVGFHLENNTATVDFDGELTREQLDFVEEKANGVVFDNVAFTTYFPKKEELPFLEYRSKLDLTDNVRLVTIEGIDVCACCAPHVEKSGEIGLIKILDFTRHRGGIRLTMKCGSWALFDYREKYSNIRDISNLLSIKQEGAFRGVEKEYEALSLSKRELYEFKMKCVFSDLVALGFENKKAFILNSYYDGDMLREFVDGANKKGALIGAAFSGDDNSGYMYAVLSTNYDMNSFSKEMNAALKGRGGGRNGLIQGRVSATKPEIIEYFNNI